MTASAWLLSNGAFETASRAQKRGLHALALLEAVHAVRQHALDDRLHWGGRLAATRMDALNDGLLQPRKNTVHPLGGCWSIRSCTAETKILLHCVYEEHNNLM